MVVGGGVTQSDSGEKVEEEGRYKQNPCLSNAAPPPDLYILTLEDAK